MEMAEEAKGTSANQGDGLLPTPVMPLLLPGEAFRFSPFAYRNEAGKKTLYPEMKEMEENLF
jgi:hypothetical protein